MSSARLAAVRAHVKTSNLRPILTLLNGDQSWLISIPRPPSERTSGGKAYYHIITDPWLAGDSIPLTEWLTKLTFIQLPAVTDSDGVEAVVREIEDAATAAGITKPGLGNPTDASPIDAIFLNFHYDDHLHKATLSKFNPRIPVFATTEAAAILQPWGLFESVTTARDLEPGTKWRDLHPGGTLPEWISVFRCAGHHELNFATAIVWTHDANIHETILSSPHGIRIDQPSIQAFLEQCSEAPRVSILAMLHALKINYAYGKMMTLGAPAGLALERQAKPKYWIKSHDAPLKYAGVFMFGVWDTIRSLDWALEKEVSKEKGTKVKARKPNLVEVENGGCFILE